MPFVAPARSEVPEHYAQMDMYDACLRRHGHEHRFMAFIDVDEVRRLPASMCRPASVHCAAVNHSSSDCRCSLVDVLPFQAVGSGRLPAHVRECERLMPIAALSLIFALRKSS